MIGTPPDMVLKLPRRPGVVHICSEAASAAAQLKTDPLVAHSPPPVQAST
jgi:hypothetical protein